MDLAYSTFANFIQLMHVPSYVYTSMCILSLLAPGHTDSLVSGLCSGLQLQIDFLPVRFCTQICWDVAAAAYAFAPLLPLPPSLRTVSWKANVLWWG